MLKTGFILLAALAVGLLGFTGSEATAFPVILKAVVVADAPSAAIVDVRYGGGGYHGGGHYNRPAYRPNYRPRYNNAWNYGYHGPRCRSWSNSCRFYYGGYYYNSPWWTLPVIGAGAVAIANGSGSRHRSWCAGRYKTYNAQTNTYVSSSGKLKQCDSPYN
jgi:hypothetical protein